MTGLSAIILVGIKVIGIFTGPHLLVPSQWRYLQIFWIKGAIAFAQYANNMADIPENGKLFQILDGLK